MHDTVLRLKKNLYGQVETTRLWFKKLAIGLEDRFLNTRSKYTCMFMSNKLIHLVYVDDCL